MYRPISVTSFVAVLLLSLSGPRADVAGQAAQAPRVDRTYALESTMAGYRGLGGEIDGIRNPTLWARTGETVRITITNGELMVHDIVLEKLGVKSTQILDRGATTSITFKAEQSDTYFCSVPGHRLAGMEGRLDVSDEPRLKSEGAGPVANGRALNLDFETGTLDRLDRDGRCVRRRARRCGTRRRRRCATGMPARIWSRAAAAAARAAACSLRHRSRSRIRTRAFSSPAARSAARASRSCSATTTA